MNGVTPEELKELRSHELPAGCEYLWQWYLRLHYTRNTGWGDGPITETELHSFFANRRIVPTAWEVNLLVRMDTAAQSAQKDDPDPDEGQEE